MYSSELLKIYSKCQNSPKIQYFWFKIILDIVKSIDFYAYFISSCVIYFAQSHCIFPLYLHL